MTLHDMQSDFLHGVYTDDEQHPMLDSIAGTRNLSATEHFDIYRSSIFGGLLNSLTDIYPVCKALVGDVFFDAMALTYIRRTPSRQPDLNHYGDDFPEFISGFPPVSGLPYLPDMARLEWAWHRAYWAADHRPLDPDSIVSIPEEERGGMIFRLPPSATLLESDYPLLHIRKMALDETEDEFVDLDRENGVRLIIWREDMELRIAPLKNDEWQLLRLFHQGSPFQEVCTHFDETPTSLPLNRLLLNVFHHGWLMR